MSKTRIHNTKTGFTIIELIAVIVILGVCLAPISVLFYNVMSKLAEPEAIQVATALAESEMERVTGIAFASVVDEGPTAFTNFPDFTYQVTVSTLSGESDTSRYKQVEMAVVNSVLDMSVSLVTIVSIKQDPS